MRLRRGETNKKYSLIVIILILLVPSLVKLLLYEVSGSANNLRNSIGRKILIPSRAISLLEKKTVRTTSGSSDRRALLLK